MDDKEVGDLWRNVLLGKSAGNQSAYLTDVWNLIFKLIEERAKAYKICDMAVVKVKADEVYHGKACEDFGVDYADYLKAKDSE